MTTNMQRRACLYLYTRGTQVWLEKHESTLRRDHQINQSGQAPPGTFLDKIIPKTNQKQTSFCQI